MNRPMVILTVVGVLVAIITVAAVLYGAMVGSQVTCEVCMTFNGRQACRSASGPDAKEAERTATDNACSFLAGGMTQIVACTTRTAPTTVSCSE